MSIDIPNHDGQDSDLPASYPDWMTTFIRAHGGVSLPKTAYTGDGLTSVTRIMTSDEIMASDLKGRGHLPFAEDGMGNTICVSVANGEVAFHDHETDEIAIISPDANTFLADLRYDYSGVLPKYEIVSTWTKPGFVPTFD